jgi:UDP-N-acetylmuramate--alanine ligase
MHLQPMISIVTNIDNDHLATHEGDFARLKLSFVDFLHNLPFYGLAVLCTDDEQVRSILEAVARPFVTYGFAPEADIRAVNVVRDGLQSRYEALRAGREPLSVTINLPGRHNVLNSLAAVAVATELDLPDAAIQRALAQFQGIDRRLQQLGEIEWPGGRALIVDDYGHHPTEVAATVDAVRQGWPTRRLVLVFQPHRYTRTRDLLDDFGRALSECDVLLVTEVYAAGEAPIAGADGRAICRAVRTRGHVEPIFIERVDDLADSLRGVLQDGDVVLTMGAGNIGAVAHDLKSRIAAGAPPGARSDRRHWRPNSPRASSTTYPWRSTRPGTWEAPPICTSRRATPWTWRPSCASCRRICRCSGSASAATSWCAMAESAVPSSPRMARWGPSNA